MDVLWKENNVFYNVLCVLITENEKLFDRSDAKLYWSTVYHMFAILHHGYVVNFSAGVDLSSEYTEIMKLRTYKLAYLTGWNFSFQTTFLGLALVYDLLQWFDKEESNLGKKIKYFRDIIFNGLVFPFTCFVTSMFWCVYLIDRELVFPQVYDQIMPWWLNHCVHTTIFVVIIIETILTRRRQPADVKIERFLWVFVSIFYAVVYYSIYFFGGCWLYGVFGVMTWWQVCLYQSAIWFMTWVFYRMAFVINRMFHNEEDTEVEHNNPKIASSDVESRETTFETSNKGGILKNANLDNGNDSSKLGTDSESKENKDKNGENLNGKTNDTTDSNDVKDNGKDWKSIGENNGVNEAESGSKDQPFEKSWSTKYRTSRTQFEKSSL